MPRPSRKGPNRRVGPAMDALDAMSTHDLIAITTAAPGMVTTSDHPQPWHASPLYMARAERILRERGAWNA
jgi:hypothetical protein